MIFPAHRPALPKRYKICIIHPALIVILTIAFFPQLINAQHRSGINDAAVDTLSLGDFLEEESIESDMVGTENIESERERDVVNKTSDRSRELEILKTVMGFMGTPYRRYGADRSGFDCSGFTSRIFLDVCGIIIPHSSREQYSQGKHINRNDLRFGDLVFFTLRGKFPSHVGIYIGDGLFAHSSIKRGVTVSLIDNEYYLSRYFGACRILE